MSRRLATMVAAMAASFAIPGIPALLTGCSLAPDYQRPAVAQPQAFREMPADWKAAEPGDALPRGPWWTRYGDATLDALEQRISVANQDLKAALARLDQARALAAIAKAPSLPLLTATASTRHARISETTPYHPATSSPVSNDSLLGVNLSYELDLWGRVRNASQSAAARAEASAADLESLRLSLHAELASDYFVLRGHEQVEHLLGEALDAAAQALALSRHRHDGGLVTAQEVNQAQAQVENIRTARADIQLKRAQLLHAIAVLVGAAAPDFAIPTAAAGALPATVPTLAPLLPSALLERRPDVAAAERRVYAANADIGVARAAYFPTFSIGAAAGYESARRATLFEAPSRFWSFGPQAVVSLFDAGRTGATVDLARSAVDEAAANYRRVVLTAYKEAEDSLAAARQLDQEIASQSAAEAAAGRTLELVRHRYQGGLVTFLPVASAQLAVLQARQSGVSLRVARLNADVQLLKALGGDWQSARAQAGE